MKLQVEGTYSDGVFHVIFLECCDKEYFTSGALKLYREKAQIQSLAIRFNEIIILVIFSLGCQSTFFFFFS